MTEMLRGATAVRTVVADYLKHAIPLVVQQAREEWQLTEYQLPFPLAYDAYEPYALSKWPLLGIVVSQASNFERVDYHSDMSQHYLTRYNVRVFTWVRTPFDENEIPIEPEYSEAIRLRDDLSACVRVALLRTGSLGRPEIVKFDESSLSEEYSETTAVKGERAVSGVVHSFTVQHEEVVPVAPLGSVGDIVVGAGSINDLRSATVSGQASLAAN